MIKKINSVTNLIGTWKLGSYKVTIDTGEPINLWGENAAGILIYLPNGHMSVHVSDQDRNKFDSNDFLSGTHKEIKDAFERYTTYYGKYEYQPEEEVVFHHITEALYPNWSGITQKRFAILGDNKLIIKTPPISINNKECVMELHWDRV